MPPVPLALQDGSACGLLEDTRNAKRLLLDSGAEMISAHLSGFAYRDPASAALLLRRALALAESNGLPALFVSVPFTCLEGLQKALQSLALDHTVATATLFGHDLKPGHDWWIDTAEI